MRRLVLLLALVMLGGCGGRERVDAAPRAPDWRQAATDADRARLRGWRETWLAAVARARAGGAGRELAAQAPLFDPDATLGEPVPPTGDYRCRVFKLGGRQAGARDFTAYPAFACRIEADGAAIRFRKLAGSQRPTGGIFPATTGRAVFLGTMLLGDEQRPIDYGRDAARDMAGFVERVGPKRWRIALPQPAYESMLDVIELVPAGR